MPISFDFTGVNQFGAAIEAMTVKVDAATRTALETAGRSSREIVRPQNERTGRLRESIEVETTRLGFGSYEAEVGPTAAYTRIIELGRRKGRGRPGSRGALPWFLPGFERATPALGEQFAAAWRAAIVA